MTTKLTLTDIAARLRGQINSGDAAYAAWRLSGGLELVLSRADERWCLTMKRPDVAPSVMEISICRAAFGVPAESEGRPFARRMLTPKTRDLALYRGVEFCWCEIERAP
jgi:hypothetical protein